jgi:hypothetical protein
MGDLETRILELEKVQATQMADLKMSAVSIVEGFSPSNMVRSALKDVVQSPDLRKTAINTAIGIGAGFLGRKLFVGRSNSIFKKISGSAVQFLITNFVRKRIPEMQEKS